MREMKDAELDPLQRLADLAKLQARLAEPFAMPATVHAEAGTSDAALRAAEAKWRPELTKNPALPKLYAELFKRERDRLREGVTAPLPSPDETALGSVATLAKPLPFSEGEYRPEALPLLPRRHADLDPDPTVLPTPGQLATLPFGPGRDGGTRRE